MGFIYKITNKINGKIYIGKTEFSIKKRWKEHIADSKKGFVNRPLYNAMNKYGISNFLIEQIEECENLNERERYWIQYYDTYKNGYNATLGGDGKSLIDYNLIIDLFNQGLNISQISKLTGHDRGHISDILISKGHFLHSQIKNQSKKDQERPIRMLHIQTKEQLNIFKSVAEASQYCIDNKLSCDSIKGISAHISQCCNGIRKTAYKHQWEYC